jgi:hypothetical protein
MSRLRYDDLEAAVGTGGINASATSLPLAAALTYRGATATPVPNIASPDYLPITVLDSSGKYSEEMWITAYTQGANSATVARAQEGSTAASHAAGDKIVHAPTAFDFARSITQLRKSANQSIANGVWTAITWDIEDYDPEGRHDNLTNNSRVTVSEAGTYLCSLSLLMTTTGGGSAYVQFAVNGTRIPGRQMASNTTNGSTTFTRPVVLAAGDYVEAMVYGSLGMTLGTVSDDANVFSVTRL